LRESGLLHEELPSVTLQCATDRSRSCAILQFATNRGFQFAREEEMTTRQSRDFNSTLISGAKNPTESMGDLDRNQVEKVFGESSGDAVA
jgi:hypothetical protein